MGRSKGGDGWFILLLVGVGVGAVALYYTQAGRGQENDAALLPNDLEGRIDLVVGALNKQFGKSWVDLGLDSLEFYLKRILPPDVVALVNVIYQVEQLSKRSSMTSNSKRQAAVNGLRRSF
jgi:hypothetical protein